MTTQTIWRRLTSDDKLQCGDFWASEDPNTPEKQRGGCDYNLQMQAVNSTHYGTSPDRWSNDQQGTDRGYWRPVGFRKIESVYFDDPRA